MGRGPVKTIMGTKRARDRREQERRRRRKQERRERKRRQLRKQKREQRDKREGDPIQAHNHQVGILLGSAALVLMMAAGALLLSWVPTGHPETTLGRTLPFVLGGLLSSAAGLTAGWLCLRLSLSWQAVMIQLFLAAFFMMIATGVVPSQTSPGWTSWSEALAWINATGLVLSPVGVYAGAWIGFRRLRRAGQAGNVQKLL